MNETAEERYERIVRENEETIRLHDEMELNAARYIKLSRLMVDYKFTDIPFLEVIDRQTDSKYVTIDTLNNVLGSIQDESDL